MASDSLGGAVKSLLRPVVRTAYRWIWRLRGSQPGDPYSFFKQDRLRQLGARYDCSTLVETGTYVGDTIMAVRRSFERVLSIELSPELYQRNQRRFEGIANVRLWQGDSGALMPAMLNEVKGRALFWLDGHYSGPGTAKGNSECPVIQELAAIADHPRKDHCILIDDAHLFGESADYPTLQAVRDILLAINPDYRISVDDNCIIAVPPLAGEPLPVKNRQAEPSDV